jgi:signal transduction histidine kinase
VANATLVRRLAGATIGPMQAEVADPAPDVRSSKALAWTLWAVAAAAFVLGLGFGLIRHLPGDLSTISEGPAFAAFGVVGLVVALREPQNPIGWIYLAVWVGVSFLFGIGSTYATWAAVEDPSAPGAAVATWLENWAWVPIFTVLLTYPFLFFPTGRLPSPRWRPLGWAIAISTVAWSIAFALEEHDYTDALDHHASNPYTPAHLGPFFDAARVWVSLAVLGCVAVAVGSLIMRYRRASGEEREQIRWLMFSASLTVVWLALPLEHGNGGVVDLVQGFLLMLIPVSIGIAILRYRLYDIDVVIRKTVVVGVLAVFIGAVYVAIVIGLASIADSAALRIVATALIAIAFQPVREHAERWANRLVYGRRATPYEVLARFGDRVGETYSNDDVLPRIARVIAEGTSSSRAAVWLRIGDELRQAAAWPDDDAPAPVPIDDGVFARIGADHSATVRHQGALLGAITVTKAASDPLTPGDAELVDRLADQAGLILANARLTADLEARLEQIAVQAAELRASRQRIVAAQDEERRRLERNIHDGAQQHLVALAVKLRLAKTAMAADQERGRRMLEEIRGEIDAALDTLRSLSLGIYPPLLEEQGLAAALAAQYVRSGLPVDLDAHGVGRYPIEREAAVYFSVLEALQNAAKYARATNITIWLRETQGALAFAVRDDGVGFDPTANGAGTGLIGIRDRLAVFGGEASIESAPGAGTTIRGRLPVDAGAPA